MIRIEKDHNFYRVYLIRGDRYIGDFVMMEDGFWHYFQSPSYVAGGQSQEYLFGMAQALQDLNAEWDKQLTDYFSGVSNEKT